MGTSTEPGTALPPGVPGQATARLRGALAGPEACFVPACYDALSARLIQQAGYPLTFLSGYGIAAARLGMPDVGYTTQTEVVAQVRDLCAPLPGFPVIADADTGYGNAMNVRRTVMELVRAGAAGMLLEDQVAPKRCGHTGVKAVITREEARAKLRAAVDARREAGVDFYIVARTDARTVHGFDEALARCLDFQEEGADMVFMERMQSIEEMRAVCSALRVPVMSNNSRGRESGGPYLDRKTIADIGFKLVIDPTLLFTAAAAIRQHLLAHRADDEAAYPGAMSFAGFNEMIGMMDYNALQAKYAS